MLDIWPSSFAEARKWVAAYAARYGQTATEVRRERMKSPVGEDRKALKAGRCKETWLTSDVPALYAEAVMRCRHPALYCTVDGYCHRGNCDMEMSQ